MRNSRPRLYPCTWRSNDINWKVKGIVVVTKTRKPNILLLMVDQMSALALSMHGNAISQTPNIDALAETGVVFDNAYCNSPLCAPSRFSMLTGRLPESINAFDNASEFRADIPTMAHYMSALDYHTILCGKMHFIGPDQLHGYEERLTTDVYPASFAWMPNWDAGPKYISSGVNLSAVVEAGPCVRSLQMDFDDEVEYFGVQKLYDLARDDDEWPFFFTLSFTQPHSPYTPGQEFWDRYRHEDIDMPSVAEIPYDELDALSQGLYFAHGRDQHEVTKEHIRNTRHGYYGMMSCIDDKIGHVMRVLEETGLRENTIVVFTSDHGEMLGERGMWYKHCFFEWAARVPLIISDPGNITPHREEKIVSHVDLLPTLLDLASDGDHGDKPTDIDGASLIGLLSGGVADWSETAISDYLAIGPCVPCRMIRMGRYKLHYIHGHDPLLFDMETDPEELNDLADEPAFSDIRNQLESKLMENYDPDDLDKRVRESQRRRFLIADATKRRAMWDYVARPGDESRYVRNAQADDTKGRQRFPFVEPAPLKAPGAVS